LLTTRLLPPTTYLFKLTYLEGNIGKIGLVETVRVWH
jgi:hypothetical protein